MKKTNRIISIVALLLAALMLFSSCAISYKGADPSEYVQLAAGFDFKNFKLDTTIDKMVVKDEDVTAHINMLLFELREAVKNGKGEEDVNQPGPFNKYDTLSIRTILYDKDGNLVTHDFALDSKAATNADGTLNITGEKALYLGYGDGLNTGLMAALEKAMFLSPESALLAQNHIIGGKNISNLATGALGAIPALAYVSYETNYKKADGTSHAATGGKVTAATIKHFEKIAADMETDGVGAGNAYDEILYLGLKELIERQASVEGKQIKPSSTTGTEAALTIKVYPTAQKDSIPDSDFGEKSTAIAYDYDFEDGGEDYSEGTIKVWLQGTIDFTSSASEPGAFVTTYTFPSDEKGTYKVGTTTKEMKDLECSVYVYIRERAPYTRPDYNADTVKNKLNFETDKTADADVIAAYEASIKEDLQKKCDALTKAAAKEALWTALTAKTTLLKDPVRNIKNYVREVIESAKLNYYGDGTTAGLDQRKNSAGAYVYDDFEDYLITDFYVKTDADGKYIRFNSRKEVENDLYAEGRNLVKANLLIYYLADQLGCRYTDDELLAMAQTRGAAWAKEQIEAGRDYLLEMGTVEYLEKQYPDTKATASATKTRKEQLFESWEAKSYEECLQKMLENYGEMYGETFATWDDFAKAAYPDDAYTWKDYVEAMQGEENLYGTYHYEIVLEKIYEENLDNLASAYKEIAFDATKVKTKD